MAQDFDLTSLLESGMLTEIVTVRPGQFLFLENDEANALYIVKSGTLRVMQGNMILETLGPGSIVGEMAIIDEHRRSASVIAGTHAELFRIDEAKFLSLIEGVPKFAVTVMRVMARRLRIMNERYRVRVAENAAARRRSGV
jgi:CRP/FNR family cyclic AMP-dependent transcriptional regulator